nr:hypothetical protein Q903MT_gene1864 [Picea sitchensis]
MISSTSALYPLGDFIRGVYCSSVREHAKSKPLHCKSDMMHRMRMIDLGVLLCYNNSFKIRSSFIFHS